MIHNLRFKKIGPIILILLLAFVLRFWKLGDYPALNADEAAIGYNAYSLLETGRDEHGNSWPIHFQSFNDYKPGLYFYLVLPFVKVFGLNAWSVRTPNALMGVMSVYLLYLLTKKLFGDELRVAGSKNQTHNPITRNNLIALTASFMLAISPWHLHYSRGGWEVNTATFLILAGVYCFLKILDKQKLIYFILCPLFFVLSLYTYHSARVIVPLLVVGLVIIYRDSIKKYYKYFLYSGLLMLVAIMPLMKDFTKSDVLSRAAGVGLFADPGPLTRINEQRGEHTNLTALPTVVLHNKAANYGLAFLDNWSRHFHGEFLFLSGDVIQRNRVPETGQLYLFDIIFLVIGFVFIFRNYSQNTKPYSLILLWLIIAPTAAALTFQSPHALRAENMIIPLTIISAIGLFSILEWLKNQKKLLFVIGNLILAFIIAWSVMRYLHMYWVHMAKEYPFSSQYGMKEFSDFVKNNLENHEKIVISDKYDQPYILLLFYLKYDPAKFQQNHVLSVRDKYGFSTVGFFDKFVFKSIDWESDKQFFPNSLIIGAPDEIPKEANIVQEIYGTNGYKYFEVVEN